MNLRFVEWILPLQSGSAKVLALFVLFSILISHGFVDAAQNKRPFWTEKFSFVEGEDLFVVGVASNMKSVEEGRLKAFENGTIELMNYAQITDLEAQGLLIEGIRMR